VKKIALIFVFLLSTVSLTSALNESWSEWSNYWKVGNVEEFLSVEINSNTTTVYEGESIQFFSNVSGGVSQYTYYWNFGEEGISYEKNPIYNFSSVGDYTCILTVTDSMYVSISDSIVVCVINLPSEEEEEDNTQNKKNIPDVIPDNEPEDLIFIPKNDILRELCMFRVCFRFPFLFVILSLVTTETLIFKSIWRKENDR